MHRRTKGHNIMFKLDMIKAFDRVSLPFLRKLLLRFGFHSFFVDIVMQHLSSSWFFILLEGDSFGFFKSSRSLKQGDLLSSLLVILLNETLSAGFKKLVQDNLFTPYSLMRGALSISYLCFADDLIIFTRASRENLHNLFTFLHNYE